MFFISNYNIERIYKLSVLINNNDNNSYLYYNNNDNNLYSYNNNNDKIFYNKNIIKKLFIYFIIIVEDNNCL